MLITAGYFFFRPDDKKDSFSYVKKEPLRQEFTEAIIAIEKKVPYKKRNYGPLANLGFSAFLDPNNPYHILLSHKILKQAPTPWDLAEQNKEDKALREYEARHSLVYAEELTKIIKNGDFEQHQEILDYIRQEIIYFDPEFEERSQQKTAEKIKIKNKSKKFFKVETI